jgi:hypothetical protein
LGCPADDILIILPSSCGEPARLLFVAKNPGFYHSLKEAHMISLVINAGALARRLLSGAASLAGDMRWSYLPPLMVYFAVMAAFTNLALSASQPGTKYLNRLFVVERGHYDELGLLMIVTMAIGLGLPVLTVWALQPRANEKWRSLGAKLKLLRAYFTVTQSR